MVRNFKIMTQYTIQSNKKHDQRRKDKLGIHYYYVVNKNQKIVLLDTISGRREHHTMHNTSKQAKQTNEKKTEKKIHHYNVVNKNPKLCNLLLMVLSKGEKSIINNTSKNKI